MDYSGHSLYPKFLEVCDEMRAAVERSRSRLSDVLHYATHLQWDDVKTALDEVAEIKRRLNDLWKRGVDTDQLIRGDVQASAAEPAPAKAKKPKS